MSIFTIIPSFRCKYEDTISIFEIYPQSETPLLTQIAHVDWFTEEDPAHLLPDTLIFRVFHEDRIVFRVVDYRTKYSTRFSVDVSVKMIGFKPNVEVFFVLSKMLKLASNYWVDARNKDSYYCLL